MGREAAGNGVFFTARVECGPPKTGRIHCVASEAGRRACVRTPLRRVWAEPVRDHPSLRQPPPEITCINPWHDLAIGDRLARPGNGASGRGPEPQPVHVP
jgi:hypothetical protein